MSQEQDNAHNADNLFLFIIKILAVASMAAWVCCMIAVYSANGGFNFNGWLYLGIVGLIEVCILCGLGVWHFVVKEDGRNRHHSLGSRW